MTCWHPLTYTEKQLPMNAMSVETVYDQLGQRAYINSLWLLSTLQVAYSIIQVAKLRRCKWN